MKILVVCQYYFPENFVISKIAENFVNKGHDVTVLTGQPNYGYGKILDGYEDIKYEVINGVKVRRVKISVRQKNRLSIILNYLSFWKNSKKWVKRCKEKFDVVYSMSLSPVTILAAGNLYKKKHHVKHVVHCVDLWPESVLITHAVKKESLFYKILYKWSKKLYEKADKILIGSKSFKDYFLNVLDIKDKPLIYIPQPSLVEDSFIAPYQYNNEKTNILCCGNLGLIQLIDLIPEAMNLLKEEDIVFHIIGMGPKSSQLEEDIKKYSLEEKVIYYGPIIAKNAAAYFKSADAIYVSLKNDGVVGKTIPNKLVMSMAFGKPIIATLSGDGKDILMETQGDLFAEENATSVAETIKKFLSLSKEKRKEMGENNLRYYKENLTVNKISDKILKELFDN